MMYPLDAVRNLIELAGDDPERPGLVRTPDRVVRAYQELFSGYRVDVEHLFTVFEERYDEMVIVKDIDFYSTCEHHMLPFFGKVHVGYIPNGKVIGLSKIVRLVDAYSRRLQIQERMTEEIANALYEGVKPLGVGVVVEAKHLCMAARGVECQHSSAKTQKLIAAFRNDEKARMEFFTMLKG